MAVQQNECYRVVTIGYLKTFIGTNIQDASGNTVYVKSTYTDDTYCPTYGELTGGTIIQNWSVGTTPNGDTDGIVVNNRWYGNTATTYASNQLVDRNDLSVKYTRFSGLTISATKTSDFSECGESTTVSYDHKYLRYTKSITNCTNGNTTTSSEEAASTTCNQLTWHTTYGSVSSCSTYTIPKNGNISASSRSDSVYASIVFRKATKNSNTLTMYQKELTGSYSTYKPNSERKDKLSISCVATPSTLKVNGCDVNQTVTLVGTGTYDIYKTYYWTDSCNLVYSGSPQGTYTEERKTTTAATESAGSDSYTFKYTKDCCTGYTETKKLSVSYGSHTCEQTFTATCSVCSGQNWNWVATASTTDYDIAAYRVSPGTGVITECSGGTYTANATCSATTTTTYVYKDSCGNISGSPSSTTVTTTSAVGQQTGTFGTCNETTSETATLTFTCHEKSDSVTFTHDCSACASCSCDYLHVRSTGEDLGFLSGGGPIGEYKLDDFCFSGFSGTSSENWIRVTQFNQPMDTEHYFTIIGAYSANTSTSPRTATITISAKKTSDGTICSKTFEVTQSGKESCAITPRSSGATADGIRVDFTVNNT